MKKIFLDLDGTLARFNVPNALNRFATEVGFFDKLKAYKGIEYINELAKVYDLYIISASPNENADKDKYKWINRYLNNIPKENVVICRIGENKGQVIYDKLHISIDKECYLLDDYTRNLNEWETLGGIGIKRITKVSDNSRGLWKGFILKDLKNLENMLTY